MADAPLLARLGKNTPAFSQPSMGQLLVRAERKLADNPQDDAGWKIIAPVYARLGQFDKAVQAYKNALKFFPDDPKLHISLSQILTTLADSQNKNLDLNEPGPSSEMIKAAESMSTEQRTLMIDNMVERLEKKLQKQPNNLSGWLRLIRSYRVLGENRKAEAASIKARTQFANHPSALEILNKEVLRQK